MRYMYDCLRMAFRAKGKRFLIPHIDRRLEKRKEKKRIPLLLSDGTVALLISSMYREAISQAGKEIGR